MPTQTQNPAALSSVELLLGDCLELMQHIPDRSVDLVLCDLPYGKTSNEKDKPLPFGPLWEHYSRVIIDTGALLLFSQGTFFVDLVNSNRKWYRYDLVWDKQLKTGFLNAGRMPLRQHEQIAVFYKRQPTYNPQFSRGRPLHSKGLSYKSKALKNQNYGAFHVTDDGRAGSTEKYPSSILVFSKPHPSVAQHRTEKPVALCEYLIKTYSNEGDLVLDNCMGAGSIGVAAVNTGRRFLGIEIDPSYYEVANARISAAQAERAREEEKNENR